MTARTPNDDSLDESEIHGQSEEPPAGDDFFSGMFTDPQPFAQPPDEPVTVVGEVPWELRDDDDPPAAGDAAEVAPEK
jgi:hypothetical protein